LLGKIPSLSLIVPSYNHGKYLSDLIHSIYGGETSLGFFTEQTLLPYEVIIADDCSTDDTEAVVNELANKFSGIKYVRTKKNSGTPVACNTAIYEAKGEIITRIDADDMRESFSLEGMMSFQIKNMHSLIYDNGILFLDGRRMSHVFRTAPYDFNKLIHKNTIHAGIMFPKKAWEECGGYPERFRYGRDDWSFNVALGVKGYCGIHVERAGYLYRRERQNRSLRNSSSEQQKFYYDQMKLEFRDIYSGRFPMGCCGNRGRESTSPTSVERTSVNTLVGSVGMSLLEYQGSNYGAEVYYGPTTGIAYQFSVKKNRRYVDDRDLHATKGVGLLDIVEHGKYMFKAIAVEPEPEPEPVVQVQSQIVEPVEDTIEEMKLEEPMEEVVVMEVSSLEPSEDMTKIESGVIKGIGLKSVSKLEDAGIIYWEQYIDTDSDVLSKLLGISVDVIDKQKEQFV